MPGASALIPIGSLHPKAPPFAATPPDYGNHPNPPSWLYPMGSLVPDKNRIGFSPEWLFFAPPSDGRYRFLRTALGEVSIRALCEHFPVTLVTNQSETM